MVSELLGLFIDRLIFWTLRPARVSRSSNRRELNELARLNLSAEIKRLVNAPVEIEPRFSDNSDDRKNGFRRLEFPSPLPSGEESNDTVRGRLYGNIKPGGRVLVYLHGWLEPSLIIPHNLATLITESGGTLLALELPWHMRRCPTGEHSGTSFLSGDLPRSWHSIQQALAELTATVAWVRKQGATVSTMGMSLGGLVQGLYSVYREKSPQRTVLLVPASRPAAILDFSILPSQIRTDFARQGLVGEKINPFLNLLDLTKKTLRQSADSLLVVSGRSDQVIETRLQRLLVERWGCNYLELPTGHLGPAFQLIFGLQLKSKRPLKPWREITNFLGE
jgi:hypothetical protein